jgi:hypothetical protein
MLDAGLSLGKRQARPYGGVTACRPGLLIVQRCQQRGLLGVDDAPRWGLLAYLLVARHRR